MKITGRSRVYAHIGDPMAHTRTAELYNEKFAERGLDVVVVPVHVPPDGLEGVARCARSWRNLVGIGVTIPHKEQMVDLVDELTSEARQCGATNVIRRNPDGTLVGTQMDGPGFVWSLDDHGIDVAGARVLLVGAGGTAKAIAFSLARAGVQDLTIQNRTVTRAEALRAGVSMANPGCSVETTTAPTGPFDLIVNATSVGMAHSDPLPVDPAVLDTAGVVADVIMKPAETALLQVARARGRVAHDGVRMLEAQFEATVDFLGLEGGRA